MNLLAEMIDLLPPEMARINRAGERGDLGEDPHQSLISGGRENRPFAPAGTATPAELEDFEERAAILAFEAGFGTAVAEALAWGMTRKLH